MQRCRRSERAVASREWHCLPNRARICRAAGRCAGAFNQMKLMNEPWRRQYTYRNVSPRGTAILHPHTPFFCSPSRHATVRSANELDWIE